LREGISEGPTEERKMKVQSMVKRETPFQAGEEVRRIER
jgi:hypothetical protein